MTPLHKALASASLLLLLMGKHTVAQTVTADQRAGTVKLVQGQVIAISPLGNRTLQSGDAVLASDRLQTDDDASASVVLRDGSSLMVGPSSLVDLQEFSFNSTTQDGNIVVGLLKGTLRMITGLIGKTRPESVRIITPTSTIGVRGTDFLIDTDKRLQ